MDKPIQFVGVDLHQDTVTVAVLPQGATECRRVETLRHAPGRFGGRLHWATDRGLTLVPRRGTGITGRR